MMDGGLPRILVIDDEIHVLQLAQLGLGMEGFLIIPAMTGAEGLEKATSDRPDLILLDVNLPDISGLEVCRKLKASSVTRDIPVLFLSAMGQQQDVEKGLKAGGLDYVVKPFRVKQLRDQIQKILKKD